MTGGFLFSTLDRVLSWSRSNSLWFFSTGTGCCADELLETYSCRYDLERFGCVPQVDPRQADLLIVSGAISQKAAPFLKQAYEAMVSPKYVLAVGACACGGGPFASNSSYATTSGAEGVVPVDVFVPGCPPRPEAIMNVLIALQEKIIGNSRIKKTR